VTRPPNRAALLTAGWRCDGYRWYPPWPSQLSYTFAAAQLEQARQPKPAPRKAKRVKEQPHE
jgi:hypothetical protein